MFVDNSEDCDDNDSGTYPGATEQCDEADNDCNGSIDDNPVDGSTWYHDAAEALYGNPYDTVVA